MNRSDLSRQAQEFAGDLNSLMKAVLGIGDVFQVVRQKRDDRLLIEVGEGHSESGPHLPLKRESDETAVLFLRVWFRVSLDSCNEYLQVDNSVFGLWVKTPERDNPRPFVRVEYDREKRRASPAHIQIHAESKDLEWIDKSAGKPPRPLPELHFPAGGGRFRATIEDFLFFLDRDRIFTDWKPQWEQALKRSREKWEQIQIRATVRRRPEQIAEALEGIGYRVEPPAGNADG